MKKRNFCGWTTAILMAAMTLNGFAGEEAPVSNEGHAGYETVVPAVYDMIVSIEDDRFITYDQTWEHGAGLYTFEGERLLGDVDGIGFLGEWIFAAKDGAYGVFNRDMEQVVPYLYTRIESTGEDEGIALEGEEVLAPGYWTGHLYHIELSTGRILQDLGAGSELDMANAAADTDMAAYELKVGGESGIKLVENTTYQAFNLEQQRLLDFAPYCTTGAGAYNDLSCGSGGRWIYGYVADSQTALNMNYLFSGRGRLIESSPKWSYMGMDNQDYVVSSDGQDVTLMNWDGETVIEAGVFDSIVANSTSSYTYSDRWSDDYTAVVSKDGRYGIITLSDYKPQPSAWAAQEVNRAVEENIVPEDIRDWWRDSCTRLEFVRMLSLTLQRMTGKDLLELAAGREAVHFTDCSLAEVEAAASLGIIQGIGNGRFAPNHFMTREQAAVILDRTAKILAITPTGTAATFSDGSEFSSWSAESIGRVSAILCSEQATPLMQGSNGKFMPKSSYTVEQSVLTLVRMMQAE